MPGRGPRSVTASSTATSDGQGVDHGDRHPGTTAPQHLRAARRAIMPRHPVGAGLGSPRARRPPGCGAPGRASRRAPRPGRAARFSAAGSAWRTSSSCASTRSTWPSSSARARATSGVRTCRRPVGPRSTSSRSCSDQPAAVEDADPVAHLLHLGEQVRGEEDRRALPVEPQQQVADLADALRVQTVRRLVEDQQARRAGAAPRPGRAAAACPGSRRGPARPSTPPRPTWSRASSTRRARLARVAGRPHGVEQREVRPARQPGVRRRPLDQRPDLREHLARLGRASACPSSSTLPDVASTSPSSIRTVVVLPEPFGPRKP